MPLKCGKNNVGKNIRELRHVGYPQKQAVAIALSHSRKCIKRVYGIKKCVIRAMMRARFRDRATGQMAMRSAIKRCVSKARRRR